MALDNEDILKLFTRDEVGNLYFDGRKLIQWDITPPEAITDLVVDNVKAFSLSVHFSPSISTDVDYYEVVVSEPAYINAQIVNTLETSLDFSDLKPNMTYEVRVTTVDTSGNRSGQAYAEVKTEYSDTPVDPDISEARLDVVTGEAEGLTITFVNFKNTDEIILWVDTTIYNGPFKDGDTYYYPKDPDGSSHTFQAEAKNKYGFKILPIISVEY